MPLIQPGTPAKLRSPRVVRGEIYGAGRHYAEFSVSKKATDLPSLQALAVTNLTDPSVLVIPVAEYWRRRG